MKKILLFLVAGLLATATFGCSDDTGGQISEIEDPGGQSNANSDADSDDDSDFDAVCTTTERT